jgi:hypothetical protein
MCGPATCAGKDATGLDGLTALSVADAPPIGIASEPAELDNDLAA